MANVTFNGNVGKDANGNPAQAAPGETVTITVTAPDGTTSTITAITDANGNYTSSLATFTVGGTYSFLGSIPADAKFKAAQATGTFTITVLADRTLTVNVTLT